MGAIANRIQTMMPSTWKALNRNEVLGKQRIQQEIIEHEKISYMGENTVTEAEEDTLHDAVIHYVATRCVLQLAPSGIDYWSSQRTSASTKTETIEYGDRIQALLELSKVKRGEVNNLRLLADDALDTTSVESRNNRPRVSGDWAPHASADPRLHKRIYTTAWERARRDQIERGR
jgi:hypothetical protein